jgi:hypothetical protein
VAAEGGQSIEEDGKTDETAEWGGLALKVKKWYKLVGPKRTVKPTKFDDVLSVHVVQARQLPAMDKSGTSDPFATLATNFGGVKKSTKVIKKTLDPRWEEQWELKVDASEILTVKVYDKDSFSRDDLMGTVELHVNDLGRQSLKAGGGKVAKKYKRWYQIVPPGGGEEDAGEIELEFRCELKKSPEANDKDATFAGEIELEIDCHLKILDIGDWAADEAAEDDNVGEVKLEIQCELSPILDDKGAPRVICGADACSRQGSVEEQHTSPEKKGASGMLGGFMGAKANMLLKTLDEVLNEDGDEMVGDEHGEKHDFRIYVHVFNGQAPKGEKTKHKPENHYYVKVSYDGVAHQTTV